MTTGHHDDPTSLPEPNPNEIGVPQASLTAPAVKPPRWSGKKTAVAAALAITFASAGTMAAAAALPSGTGADAGGGGMRGGRMGQFRLDGTRGGGLDPAQFGAGVTAQQQLAPGTTTSSDGSHSPSSTEVI